MKLHLMLTGLLLFAALYGYGQKQTVAGTVIDNLNQPVGGAVIQRLGDTKSFTVSKPDGSFVIQINDIANDSIKITSIGYITQTVAIAGRTSIQVQLQQNVKDLNDVVVISALGLTKKLNAVTYSQQSVDVDQMTEARDVNITNLLAGKVAGLQVTGSGQPGGSARVVIRGPKSVSGNNQPLWVVDGVPIANNSDGSNNLDYGNAAQDLNPDDIASIEVLQGPNAAALYGSDAANGAILVTTKRGDAKNKDWGVNINQNNMAYTVTAFPLYENIYGEGGNFKLVTNTNKLIGNTGAVQMGGTNNNQSYGAPMLGQPYLMSDGTMGRYTPQPNNVSAMYQTAWTNTSNVSISKADAVSSLRVSYAYTKGNDVVENMNLMQRHNVSLAATRKVNSHLSLDTRMMYTRTDTRNRAYKNLDNSNPMAAYVFMPRSAQIAGLKPWVDANGNAINLGTFSSDTENPFWSIYENKNEDVSDRFIGGLSATWTFTNYLKFRTQASLDYEYKSLYQYKELGGAKTPHGSYYEQQQSNQTWNYEGLLMFNKNIRKDFSINANLGTNYNNSISSNNNQFTNQLIAHNMPSIYNSSVNAVVNTGASHTRRMSVYATTTLGYKNYLYLDMTGRNDWSSTLPINNDSYFYPSIGASFVFSNLLKNKSILSYGKLRANIAGTGNSAGFDNLYTRWSNGGLFQGNEDQKYPFLVYGTQLKNAYLKPEKTKSKEIGVELGFFKNQRVNLKATVYQSNTYNQILSATSLKETGYTGFILNAGNIQNKGIELTLNAIPVQTRNFMWNVNANWSKNNNMVLSLAPNIPSVQLGNQLGIQVLAMEGKPYGELVGSVPYMVGDTVIVQTNQSKLFFDYNVPLGNAQPDWMGSFGSSFKYKNFDLSFLVTVKWGGDLYSASYARANAAGNTVFSLQGRDAYFFSSVILGENDNERAGIGQTVGNTVTYYDDSRIKGARYPLSYYAKTDANGNIVYDANGRMMPGKPSNTYVSPVQMMSDMTSNLAKPMMFDATSVRLSQMILGYTFPKQWMQHTFIKDLRVAVTGRNLWQIVQHTPQGIDPESANTSGNAQGIESGGSFPYAQYGFDLKINF